jgi:hypothetical protein
MQRLLAAGAAVVALGLAAGPAATADSPNSSEWNVRIVGSATLDPAYQDATYYNTGVLIPVKVRCPAGEIGFGVHAGFPGYFPDGAQAQPNLPGMTRPLIFECTGKPERYTFRGRSISRLQDPSTHPFARFHHGRATVVVEVRFNGGAAAVRDTKTIQIVVPPGK